MLGFRVDQRKVPAALLKKYHRMEINPGHGPKRGGQKPLSRSQKEELKERTRLELLRRIPPGTRSFDVCWGHPKAARSGWAPPGPSMQRDVRGPVQALLRAGPGAAHPLDRGPWKPWRAPEQKAALDAARPLSLYAGEN